MGRIWQWREEEAEALWAECRRLVDSGNRIFKLKSRDGQPAIDKTIWTKTILDVRTEDAGTYCAGVEAWARSTLIDSETVEPG